MQTDYKKQNVKSIKKAIQDKKFEDALKLCEVVLENDPADYNTLVFKGFSCQELCKPREARDSFIKATEIDPDQILAWKGLSAFYEKHETPENNSNLVRVYQALVKLLKTDRAKETEVLNKLVILTKTLGILEETISALVQLAHIYKELEDPRGEFCTQKSLIDFLLPLDISKHKYSKELEEAFKRSLACSTSARTSQNDISKLQKEYLLYLKKKNRLSEALVNVRSFILDLSEETYPLEFICLALCESFTTEPDVSLVFDVVEMEEFAMLLQEKAGNEVEDQWLAKMTLGAIAFMRKEPLLSLPLLSEGLTGSPRLLEGWPILVEAHLSLHNYKEAEKLAMAGLQSLSILQANKSKHELASLIMALLCVWLARALIGLRRLPDAGNALLKCQKILKNMKDGETQKSRRVIMESQECEARIALLSLEFYTVNKLGKELAADRPFLTTFFEAMIAFKKKNFILAEKCITSSLESRETAEGLHMLSVIQWEHGNDRPQALRNLLKACKADPFFARNYLYLGHFYRFQCNPKRAEQCYLKAHQLDPFDAEIACSLSDLLYENNCDNLLHIEILKNITFHQTGLQWAWRRLGLCQLQAGSSYIVEAISAFQNSIRLDADDSRSWECLGDAYLLQGSYGASLRAFERVSEIRGNNIYSSFQVAKIKHFRGYHKEALSEYEAIYSEDSEHIGAIEGIVKCKLSLALMYKSQSLFGLARDQALEGLALIFEKILPTQNTLSCFYKLNGDLCSLLGNLGSSVLPLDFDKSLYGLKKESPYTECDLLNSANCCFGRAVALDPNSAPLWHDLGISYYKLYKIYESELDISSENSSKAIRSLNKSMACLTESLRLCPNDPRHWSALGTVAANSPSSVSLAQHCFIKSLQLDPNSVIAWTNLGLLYLKTNDIKLAHQAFQMGQSVEPSCPNPWLSQALVAESIQDEETLDLFRHSTILGNNPESLLGYGYWLCDSLLTGKEEDSNENSWTKSETKRKIIQAADSLFKYTAFNTSSVPAYCYLSLLLERQGLFKPASDAARKALHMSSESKLSVDEIDVLKANLARLLRKTGSCKESVLLFETIKNLDVSVYNEIALAHIGAGCPEKAYKAYELAFKSSIKSCPEFQSHILTAMAFVARKIPNVELKDVKTLLFKSLNCKPQSIPGVLALAALGFLESNNQLTTAALAELENYRFESRFWPEIANLLALHKASQGDLKGAVRQLCSAVHWQPSSAQLWSRTATFMLLSDSKNAEVAARCAAIADVHRDSNFEDTTTSHKIVSALCNLALGRVSVFRQLVLKAVHVNPGDLKAWSCLSLANLLNCKNTQTFTRIFDIIRTVMSKQDSEVNSKGLDYRILEEWLTAIEAYRYFLQPEADKRLIPRIVNRKEYKEKRYLDKVEFLMNFIIGPNIESTLTSLSKILNKDNGLAHQNILWMSLVKGRLLQKKFSDAEGELQNWLKALEARKISELHKLIPLLFVSLVAKEAAQQKSDRNWLTIGQESIARALKISSKCQAAHFIAALLAIEKGTPDDIKFAQRSLERCLNNRSNDSEELISISSMAEDLLAGIQLK